MSVKMEDRLELLKALVKDQLRGYTYVSWDEDPTGVIAFGEMMEPSGSVYKQALQILYGLTKIRDWSPDHPHLDQMLKHSVLIAFDAAPSDADKEGVVLIAAMRNQFDLIPQALC